MSLADDLKPVIDRARAIAGSLGFRPYTVSLVVRSWSGARPGLGTATTTETPLTVADGQNPKVKKISQREVIASGGLYQAQDLEVTLTAAYSGGGYATTDFDPTPTSSPTEVYFRVEGPGIPSGGCKFKKVAQTVDSALTYRLVLRNDGVP